MRILLVQSPLVDKFKPVPPIGLGYLASYLEIAGHTVKIILSSELEFTLKNFNPEIIGFSSVTRQIYNTLETIKKVKLFNPDVLTIIGGPHPTVKSKEILAENKEVDVVVRGEGELTIVELADKFEKKINFSDIKGITYRSNGKIVENINRPFIEELDSLPFPAYHLLTMTKYKNKTKKINPRSMQYSNRGSIFTSRGCPYSCAFCASRALWGKKLRSRSPENIVEELKLLKYKYNLKYISFLDDTFTMNKKKVVDLCHLIRKEKLDIFWGCGTRVDRFDKEIALAIKKAGCEMIGFGIESGVQSTLDFLKKGFSPDDSIRAVKNAKDVDLKVWGNFIICVPGETKKDINQTIKFAKKLELNQTVFSPLFPFPGTDIYEYAEKNNLILSNDYSKYCSYNIIMKIPGFTPRELKGFVVKAYILNYIPSKPSQIYNKFEQIMTDLKRLTIC